MWLIRGPFEGTLDGAPLGTMLQYYSELLKPSTEYPCGRRQPKDGPDSKKIMLVGKGTSRQSGTFAVGAFPDNLNSDAVLSLKLPEKDKPRIIRDGTDVEPDSNDSILLHGGDIFRKAITISIIHETLYVYLPPSSSIDRDAAKGFASRGKAFGFRVSRLWSDIASHYILDSVPTAKGPEPFEYPIEFLCGLLSGSNFVTAAWLEALLAKAELPFGSGNLEDRYDPPRPEDFCPTGPGANLWQPSESRQGLLKDVKFIILYDGAEPKKNFNKLVEVAGATAVTYSISSDKAADTPEKWAQYIRKARSKRGADEQKASTIVLIGLQAEVLQTHDDWDRVYVEGAQHMDMRVIFEHDLALAILHADLEYINCSLEHDLPQQASQKVREPSPSPARFPSAQVVRSTLEEETLNTTQKVLAASKKRTFDAVESSDDIVKEEPETYPRQRPRKRVQLPTSRNALFGLDDSMVDDDDTSVTPAVAPSQSAPPESARHASLSQSQSYPTARSSRRTTQSYRPNMSSILGLDTLDEEPVPVPVAQRFKAEFESKLIGGTAKPRPRMKQKEEEPEEYYPQEPPVQVLRSDDELEDEDEPPPRRAGTRVTSQVASRAKGKGKAAPATTSSRRGGRALAAIDEDESLEDFGAAMAAAVPAGDTQDDSMDVDANDSTIDPSAPATSTNMNTNSRATRSSGRSTAPSARGLRATSVAASASGMSTRRSRSVSVDPQSSQVQSSSAGGGTSANTGTTTAARKRPRKIEQDSDDEVAFKGLGKRAKK
ncbi:hypothetical protein DL93DRAFT_2094042 [Clavulina sp. PMI_390]|nr:hypothetical protein DL93DRAFT_2094042 [Clavulina sp. PMI_390]